MTEAASPQDKAPEPTPIDRAFLSKDPDAGQLILVRHGQQQWPDPDTSTIGDWVDPPLSELGRNQAECVGRYLAEEPIAAVYSSQLLRANDTGKAIASHHDLDVTVFNQLEEFHFYGKLPADSRPSDVLGEPMIRGARERFAQTRSWDSYPESESSLHFRQRVGYAIEAVTTAHPGETVVVACHGGVINAYLVEILGLRTDMFFRPVHASVHRLVFKGQTRVIESLNEKKFLETEQLLSH